jgi:HTH-type transcriptional regulator, competence development regulator
MNKLAAILADARKRLGLTLRAVETKTGISNAYLSQLENGRIKEPSPTVLHKLSELYRIPYNSLMAAAGYPIPGSATNNNSSLAARIGPTSDEEDDALVQYLKFIRTQRRGRRS